MKQSDILRQKIADYTDEAEALANRLDTAGCKLTAAEQKRWDELMAKDTGLVAAAQTELEHAVRTESERERLRMTQVLNATPQTPVFNRNGDGPYTGTDARVVEPKLTAFSGPTAHRDAFDFALQIKAFAGDQGAREKLASRRGTAWVATLNETTPTDGGYLVAPEVVKQLTAYREQVGVSRKLCRVYRMATDNLTFAKQSTGATCYYTGEEQTITDSSQSFSTVTLQPKKKAVLTYVSSELDADAMVSVVDAALSDMGHQLALQEDKEFILGDATSTYGGQTGVKVALTAATASLVSAATGNDTWPEITYADLAKVMAAVPDKYAGSTMSWLCSAAFKYQVFDRLTLAQGGAAADAMTSSGVSYFAGHPIVTCDRMPTTTAAATLCAIFGAFSNAVAIGDKGGIKLAISPHVAFASDRLALRATVRTDLVVHEQGDTTNAGAIIGLKTAA